MEPSQANPESRRKIDTTSAPPIGAPSWCLNQDALERFNRSNDNIPIYDQDTDSVQESDNDIGHESNDNRTKKKRKSKKKSKKRNKKHKK
jgi:hypothetical protein